MGGCRGRLLPGRHLLACDARLENRVGQSELGGHSGNRRRTPPTAYIPNPASSAERLAEGMIHVQQLRRCYYVVIH